MSFDWSQYVDIAESLLNSEGDTQSRYRASISRAYYGVMHLAKIRLNGFASNQEKIHSQLLYEYQQRKNPDDVYICTRLRILLEARQLADYNDNYVFHEEFVKARIKEARQAVNFMKSKRR